MRKKSGIKTFFVPWRYIVVLVILFTSINMSYAEDADVNAAASLRARHVELQERLDHNQFQLPIYLNSSETSDRVTGDVYAVINHPFTTLGPALIRPDYWCDILILHLNTKYCHASSVNQGTIINMNLGRKYYQPLDDTHRVDFVYRVGANSSKYLKVSLVADKGPLSTHDYRIWLEAIPLESGKSFIHLTYSYAYGLTGRLAMQAYLGTIGSGKVGFTIVGKGSDNQSTYVGGTRGAAERNTMRYYLAIEAFLGSLSVPTQERIDKSFRDWFASTERYPRQLHEIDQNEYLEMKRREYLRQQTNLYPAK